MSSQSPTGEVCCKVYARRITGKIRYKFVTGESAGKMTLRNHASICLADIIVNILRGKWAMHILLAVGEQNGLHFSAIRRSIPGISAKVLSEQLDYLLAAGVVQRMTTATARHEVIYSYTERGKELRVVLDALNELAHRWQASDDRTQDGASAQLRGQSDPQ